MNDELFEKACHEGDLKTVKKMVQENEEYREWIDDCHPDIMNWAKYGDLPDKIEIDTRTLIKMIDQAKSHNFWGGDWETEMEYNERGGGYECNIPSYIRDMENIVDTLHEIVNKSKTEDDEIIVLD